MKALIVTAVILTSCSTAKIAGDKTAVAAGNSSANAESEADANTSSKEANSSVTSVTTGADVSLPKSIPSSVPATPALDERADIPKPLNGAYLHCSVLQEDKQKTDLGCSLKDNNSVLIATDRLGSKVSFTTSAVTTSQFKITTTHLTHTDRLYDAIFRFESSNLISRRNTVLQSQVSVTIENPKAGVNSVYAGQVSRILVVPNNNSNFRVIKAEDNKLIVLDRVTGAYFIRLVDSSLNWQQTVDACLAAKANGWDDWRMAHYTLFPDAHAHGLAEVPAVIAALYLDPQPNVWVEAFPVNAQSDAYYLDTSNRLDSLADTTLPKSTLLGPPLCQR